ncbi:hypothetical protein [Bradyrhizobium sp.]|uniref:hypothetical protein n=1 Tax=Bradyrhizobium sp. TaxID=376 RepID=UPI002620E8AC|nr:hypothetical protein [Bradyrhizobium sp.]
MSQQTLSNNNRYPIPTLKEILERRPNPAMRPSDFRFLAKTTGHAPCAKYIQVCVSPRLSFFAHIGPHNFICRKLFPPTKPFVGIRSGTFARGDDLFLRLGYRVRLVQWPKLIRTNMTTPRIHGPLAIALAVAVFGIAAMLLVDHGPWTSLICGRR